MRVSRFRFLQGQCCVGAVKIVLAHANDGHRVAYRVADAVSRRFTSDRSTKNPRHTVHVVLSLDFQSDDGRSQSYNEKKNRLYVSCVDIRHIRLKHFNGFRKLQIVSFKKLTVFFEYSRNEIFLHPVQCYSFSVLIREPFNINKITPITMKCGTRVKKPKHRRPEV